MVQSKLLTPVGPRGIHLRVFMRIIITILNQEKDLKENSVYKSEQQKPSKQILKWNLQITEGHPKFR